MGPPSYMRSVVDRNVVMRSMPVHCHIKIVCLLRKCSTTPTRNLTSCSIGLQEKQNFSLRISRNDRDAVCRLTTFNYSRSNKSYVFRQHKAAIIRSYASENLKRRLYSFRHTGSRSETPGKF